MLSISIEVVLGFSFDKRVFCIIHITFMHVSLSISKLLIYKVYAISMQVIASSKLKLNLKPRIRPNPRPVLLKKQRHKTHSQRNKRQHRVSPAQSQSLIHRITRQWQYSSEKRAQKNIRCRHRRRIPQIRINQIRTARSENSHKPKAKYTSPNNRHDPMHLLVSRPSIPEKAYWNEPAAVNHR